MSEVPEIPKFSVAALETLRMIAEKPRLSTKTGHGDYVSGASVSGLIRRGYARWIKKLDDVGFSQYFVEITDAGRAALASANGVQNLTASVEAPESPITLGSRVRIVDAPNRPTYKYALREQRNAEGIAEGVVTSFYVLGGGTETRCIVRFDDGSSPYWFYIEELRLVEVMDLTASVEVYEVKAPLRWDAEVTEPEATLMPELDNVEWIEAGCRVNVTPEDTRIRPFYGTVQATNLDTEKALVLHLSGKFMEWFGLDEMKLIYSAEEQKKTPATEVTSVS